MTPREANATPGFSARPALAKGNIARAVAALKEGHSIAVELADLKMAERFAAEILNAEKPADPRQ